MWFLCGFFSMFMWFLCGFFQGLFSGFESFKSDLPCVFSGF